MRLRQAPDDKWHSEPVSPQILLSWPLEIANKRPTCPPRLTTREKDRGRREWASRGSGNLCCPSLPRMARRRLLDSKHPRLRAGVGGEGCLQPALLLGPPSELPSLPCAPARVPTPSRFLPWCSSITRAPSPLVFSLELCLRLALHSVPGCGPQLCLSGYAFPSFTSSTFSLSTLFISLSLCFASSLPVFPSLP